MKTARDIRKDFPEIVTEILTNGTPGFYTCKVTLTNGEPVAGLGTTLKMAEDTAWHGVAIVLRGNA